MNLHRLVESRSDGARAMPRIPFDHSLALLKDPYRFIARECARRGTDVFETRILFRRTICMTGPPAAELFYDAARFQRAGAAPEPLRATLFGKGGVQMLDDAAFRHRKAMFMTLMTPARIAELAALSEAEWARCARLWTTRDQVVLYEEVKPLLARAVCAWAGVPLAEPEVRRRTRDLALPFEGAGMMSRHVQARRARRRTEAWLEGLIERHRAGEHEAPPDSALAVMAQHLQLDGRPLPAHVAAVELLNVLLPVLAVAVYVAFIAHAIHQYPQCRQRLQLGETGYLGTFVEEVRRFYPFVPAVVAQVRQDFEWRGYRFERGTRALLDVYGTNHDPRYWEAPDRFRPERFRTRQNHPFGFLPQGGGDPHTGHRCAGEEITVELMKVATAFLAMRLEYEVPPQDLRVDERLLPARPHDGVKIRHVRLRG